MISKLSIYITNFFIDNKIILEKNKKIYLYGTEVTISTTLNFLLILLLGLLFNSINYTVIFLICFVSIRIYTGGYHADSYIKCNIIFCSIYILYIFLLYNIPQYINFELSIFFSIISLIAIIILSPIENKNKPFYYNERKKYKKRSIIITISCIVISLIYLYYNINILMPVSIILLIISVLIIIEKIKIMKEG